MTDKQLEMARTFTDKEVMSNAINELRGLTINEMALTSDITKKSELMEQQKLLAFEAMAVLGDDEIAHSIQDKVLKLYGPILRKRNGVE